MNTSQIILQQLGGNVFVAMTGARHLVGSPDALQFKLPANFAKDGINTVRVSIDTTDTYTVEFGRSRGISYKTISVHLGIYAEMLRDLFTAQTGLDTIMPRIFTRRAA